MSLGNEPSLYSSGPGQRSGASDEKQTNHGSVVRAVSRDDRRWVAMLAISFVVGLAASWQRWAGLVIDSGREMNQPLRLASGEMLYSDVGHIYGPLSPYAHAALYRLFGPSVGLLYADGIVSAVFILGIVYGLG